MEYELVFLLLYVWGKDHASAPWKARVWDGSNRQVT